jgi:MFS transporter, FSR family, fosmidomycin resistance protein
MSIISNLLVYGSSHALVDATCVGIIFSMLKNHIITPEQFFYLVVLYNLLAFGLQFFVGLASDKYQSPRIFALIGCILTATAALIYSNSPILVVCLAGLGNCFFHIGGGSISLSLSPKRASAPGIFVAPGALGLFLGTKIGWLGYFVNWPFVLLLCIFCILIILSKPPKMDYARQEIKAKSNMFEIAILLLLLSIAIRSLIGLALVFPWQADLTLLSIFTLAVVLGKGLGGILADRFGWINVSVSALLISSLFISFASNNPYLAIIGFFLFNMTMPVTLVAVSNLLPGRPGFSFGLTCLALIIGALPTFWDYTTGLVSWVILMTIIMSTITLYLGLRLYKELNSKYNFVNERHLI